MRIIIAGAGEVGFHLAKMMTDESHDLYIIDDNEERLNYVQSQIDVFGIKGDATNIQLLKNNNISSCDLLIAATSSEETNLLICITGKKLGAKKTIARISNFESVRNESRILFQELGIDNIVSPVELASQEIVRLINQSAFTDDHEFEGGKLTAFGIQISPTSPLKNKSVVETSHLNPNYKFKPIAILRQNESFMINAESVLLEGDIVYFISAPECIEEVIKICGQSCYEIKNVMILGGGPMGVLTAQALEKKFNVTLVEKDKDRAQTIAN
ncbi:MAG: NAD-binding protein, partial [Flavobacteriales bacterium]|nr:NAD-binding protein [Flavobacteriales bacterium]